MKRLFLLATILFLAFASFSQRKNFSIRIEQGNDSHIVSGEDLNLRKEPFKIIVSLHKLDGVYLFSDFTDSIYKLNPSEKIPDFENFPAMAMAEATFNEDQELIISKDGWAYWFYDEKLDWHRFDKDIVATADSIVGIKTIKQFYFTESKQSVAVDQMDQPLYLFFAAVDKSNKKGVPTKELARLKIKITWY